MGVLLSTQARRIFPFHHVRLRTHRIERDRLLDLRGGRRGRRRRIRRRRVGRVGIDETMSDDCSGDTFFALFVILVVLACVGIYRIFMG